MKLGRTWKRITAAAAAAALGFSLMAGCGSEPTSPGPPPPPPPPDLGPFRTLEMFLRPNAIERPVLSTAVPTPVLQEYAFSLFYAGGTELATFEWTISAALGTVEPKTPNLGRNEATVILRIRPDVNLPLGFFDVRADGRSATETASRTGRFAVIEDRWMKHRRVAFGGSEPEDLILWPTFQTSTDLGGANDTIYFVSNASPAPPTILSIPAFQPLNTEEPQPSPTHLLPDAIGNAADAPKSQPDFAPHALRREWLFASTMDPDYGLRCPADECQSPPPQRIWVCRVAESPRLGGAQYQPRVLTFDSRGSNGRFIGFNHFMPKWDPTGTNPRARIAYLSDEGPDPDPSARHTNLWTGELVDSDGDNETNSLESTRSLTSSGGVTGFDWHPDGTRLCAVISGGLNWVDASSGAVTEIGLPDSTLRSFSFPSVFWRTGEHTLVAFQAQTSENLVNLYVWDEQDNTLCKLLPYPVPVTHNLFPSWHPTRKELVYVSDYTVEAWANTAGTSPGPDRLNPVTNPFFGQRRTLYPSTWVISLE